MFASLLPWLQLCRVPAVFTAVGDVVLGYLLVHQSLAGADVWGLVVSSACLYLSGMVWNDVFDRQRDAVDRPGRPLPSGRVSLPGAVGLAAGLMVGGIGAASLVSRNSLAVAGMLAVVILAYDGVLKQTVLGPVAMGGCRFLNVILGASSDWLRFEQVWWRPQIWVAAGLGVYVVGVTLFARTEAVRSRRGPLIAGLVIANVGLSLLLAWVANWPGAGQETALLMLLVIMLILNRRLVSAVYDPGPAAVQTAVRTMLLSIITLDASLIYAKLGPPGMPYVLGVLALLVPAVVVGRWIRLT
jgi:4-hydroxybenzoate polyprenyltransferase